MDNTELSNGNISKADQIKSVLSGLLSKGDSFYVGYENTGVVVRPLSDKDSLKATHTELHGVLLKYEQRLVGYGHEIWFFLLVPLLLASTIQINPLMNAGVDLKFLQSWWLYTGLLLFGFILNNWRLQKRVNAKYRQYKGEILEAIQKSGLSTDYVLSLLAKDNSLFNVKTKLMMDE